uniref:Major facilitator superfamily (MFS) profile domain-containing protein n=1 Tax=Zooxanthella nutricula TaxID=1333877 RepID=A0A7S2PCA9_9DINO
MEALRAICARPDLLKVIIAFALAESGLAGAALATPPLRAEFWGKRMAENGSIVEGFRALVMLLLTPAFGRVADKMPRKWALMAVGLVQSLPVWPLLFLGRSAEAMWVSAGLRVLSGACGSAAAAFAMINDFTSPKERGAVFAAGAMLVTVLSWLPRTCVAVLAESFKGWLMAPCLSDLACLVAFVAVVASIGDGRCAEKVLALDAGEHMAPNKLASSCPTGCHADRCESPVGGRLSDASTASEVSAASQNAEASEEASPASSADSEDAAVAAMAPVAPAPAAVARISSAILVRSSSAAFVRTASALDLARAASAFDLEAQAASAAEDVSTADTRAAAACAADASPAPRGGCCAAFNVADTARLVCSTPQLLSLCAIGVLIATPEIAEHGVTPQYMFQAFGAMESPDRIERMTLIATYVSMATRAAFFGLASIISKRVGLLPFLRWLIPLTAVVQLLPLLFLVSPTLPCLALVSALAPIGIVADVPLSAVVSVVVPADRVGEALSAVTAFKAVAPLVGNLAVAPMIELIGTSRLWMFYPVGAATILLAWPLVLRLPAPEAGAGAGAKAGAPADV